MNPIVLHAAKRVQQSTLAATLVDELTVALKACPAAVAVATHNRQLQRVLEGGNPDDQGMTDPRL